MYQVPTSEMFKSKNVVDDIVLDTNVTPTPREEWQHFEAF